jgi:hypothetical protein
MALGYGNEAGLLAVLDNAEGDALLEQWRDYRDAMKTTAPRPSKLEIGALTTGPIEAGRAQVVAEVRPVWWGTSGGLAVNGEVHTWTFLTREDDGWQISAVEPFTWCGGYVRADACAGG